MYGCGGIEMNERGFLFTVMTLFLGISIISSAALFSDISKESFTMEESLALTGVAFRFDNIYREIIDLDKTDYAKTVSERAIPFKYDLNKQEGTIIIRQDLPLSQPKLKSFFDSMNLSSIFFNDTNINNIFDGVNTQINSPKDSAWGGSSSKVSFLINPFCYSYKLDYSGNALLGEEDNYSSRCTEAFSMQSIKRVDINISLNSGDDFNSFTCNSLPCTQNAFNPTSNLPYYSINLIDSSCPSCSLPEKISSGHFAPEIDFDAVVSCEGGACTSMPITISRKNLDFNFTHPTGRNVTISTKVTFTQKITEFFTPDVNITISLGEGGFSKRTG
jgi:hypothetical protein